MLSVSPHSSLRTIVCGFALTAARSAADETCMLQSLQNSALRKGGGNFSDTDNSGFSCAPLKNRGSFSTVEIAVGTPEQVFHVVADTGSDSVIVQSCVCQDMHNCHLGDHCFKGTDHSSSFHVDDGPQGIPGAIITFGSGPIHIAVASDVVRVGSVAHDMQDGLLLMVDNDLDFGGPFEGILGLGLPSTVQSADSANLQGATDNSATYEAALVASQAVPTRASRRELEDKPGLVSRHLDGAEAGMEVYNEKSFLERAGVGRFSMCFNDDGSDGALRLNPPAAAVTLGNVGQDHWAVDFRGVSIGVSDVRVGFCGAADMQPGQDSPCAGIPDSGTTAITAPQAHLDLLFEALCDDWIRCKTTFASSKAASKPETFKAVLRDCDSWMDSAGSDLHELPPIKFHVRGADGLEQQLEMPAWAYVVGSTKADGSHVCEPAFMEMDFDTARNGPVWIFGTPFFYTYEVGYDMQTTPPGISFASLEAAPCGTCGSARATNQGNAGLFSGSSTADAAVQQRRRFPRTVSGPFRRPSIDTSKPI